MKVLPHPPAQGGCADYAVFPKGLGKLLSGAGGNAGALGVVPLRSQCLPSPGASMEWDWDVWLFL